MPAFFLSDKNTCFSYWVTWSESLDKTSLEDSVKGPRGGVVSGLLFCSYVWPLSVSRSAGVTEDRKMRQKATEEVLFCWAFFCLACSFVGGRPSISAQLSNVQSSSLEVPRFKNLKHNSDNQVSGFKVKFAFQHSLFQNASAAASFDIDVTGYCN